MRRDERSDRKRSQPGRGKVVAIIQARMTSTRLPGKVLADIHGKPMLERMLDRVRRARSLDEIIVATTVNATDDPVVELGRRLGVRVFRGDEADVLGRYRAAAREASADVVVRLTADCPMIDPAVVDQAVAMFLEGDWDYLSNSRVRTYPDGLDVEVFTRDALERAAREARHPQLREHVTLYINGRYKDLPCGTFRVGDMAYERDLSHLQWSVNTAEDLERVRRLFAALPEGFTWEDAVAVVEKTAEARRRRGGRREAHPVSTLKPEQGQK